MHSGAVNHQSLSATWPVICAMAVLISINGCMSGAGDDQIESSNSANNPNNHGNIGSIVDINDNQDSFDLITFTDAEVQNALHQQNQVDTLAVSTDTYYCNSPDPTAIDTGNGSITYTHVDEDPPGQSTNDSYATTYDNCNQGTRSIIGFSSFTVNEQTGIPYQPGTAWSITTTSATNLTLTFPNGEQVIDTSFTYSNGTVDGVTFVRTVLGSNSQSISFDGIGNSSSGIYDITRQNYTSTGEYSRDINISRSGDFGLRMTQTLTPLTGISGTPPESGVLQLTITTPTGVTSVGTYTGLGGGNVLAEIDSDNDGVIDSTQQTTWAGVPYY